MKRVLLVEDQADIRRLIRMTLEFERYEVHEAADGATGLQLAHRLRPDVLLLDVMLPGGLDGLALCERVRAEPGLGHTRVVLLTACGQPHDRAAGLRAGAHEYMVKPVSPLALVETLDRLLQPAAGP